MPQKNNLPYRQNGGAPSPSANNPQGSDTSSKISETKIPITCYFWFEGGCTKSADECLFAHYSTGRVAYKPKRINGNKQNPGKGLYESRRTAKCGASKKDDRNGTRQATTIDHLTTSEMESVTINDGIMAQKTQPAVTVNHIETIQSYPLLESSVKNQEAGENQSSAENTTQLLSTHGDNSLAATVALTYLQDTESDEQEHNNNNGQATPRASTLPPPIDSSNSPHNKRSMHSLQAPSKTEYRLQQSTTAKPIDTTKVVSKSNKQQQQQSISIFPDSTTAALLIQYHKLQYKPLIVNGSNPAFLAAAGILTSIKYR
ncbi:MAG: hypothetical protein M1834_006929 [Cirrosporium novae-zelandiae]|nr:MAG: hypothetical protein M1834_006929 [Cirrosporium novae-zelandiae]